MKSTKKRALSIILAALIAFCGFSSTATDVSAFPISGIPTAIKNAVLDSISKEAELVASYRDLNFTSISDRAPLGLAYDCDYIGVYAIRENIETTEDFDILAYVQSRDNPLIQYTIPCNTSGEAYTMECYLPAGRYDVYFDNGREDVNITEAYVITARLLP